MKQYELFEIEFKGNEPAGSNVDINLKAAFTHSDGESVNVSGFYCGDGVYKVRFLPQKSGRYTYKITGVYEESGTLDCEPADDSRHGIVKVCGTHFRYEDGTWYQPFGTTVYALINQSEELVNKTMDTLSNAPFNKIRMCVFPKDYDFNKNEPDYYAFEKDENGKWDVNRPCFKFWDNLEMRIRQLGDMGIECDLILFHPYDRWGFASFNMEDTKVYLDYLLRRLAAFPNIWWSLANEFDLMKYSMEEWQEIASYVSGNDAYNHLLSNHNCIEYWDFANKDTTHICVQVKNVDKMSKMIKDYNKPLMVDECCYEGNLIHEWGNISAFEMVNKFWKTVTQGAYCTHGETYMSDDDILWWSRGGILKGESPERIAFLRSIVEELPEPLTYCGSYFDKETYDRMRADESWENDFWKAVCRADWPRAEEAMNNAIDFTGRVGDEAFLRYYERKCNCIGTFDLPEDRTYDIEVIDVWEMTREVVMTGVSGNVTVRLPGKEGTAVYVKAT